VNKDRIEQEAVTKEIFINCRRETLFSFLIDPQKMVLWMGRQVLLEPVEGGLCGSGSMKTMWWPDTTHARWVVIGPERQSEWLSIAIESKNYVLSLKSLYTTCTA
jgi:hypothetical protein